MGSVGIGTAALLVLGLVVAAHAGTGIEDIFSWGLDYIGTEDSGKSGEGDPSLATRECSCEGPGCTCCVNFNVSFIDLGGPGCVKLKYLSQDEGMMVNVSYGDNVLHSEQVKGPKPKPACMNLLSDLAQVCARFTELSPEGDGLRGCTILEPTLLGDPQVQYPVACFKMGPSGMTIDPDREPVVTSSEEEQAAEEEEGEGAVEGATDKPDLSEEALINAVNESAEEGIAWFTSLLGLSFGGGGNSTETEEDTAPTAAAPTVARAETHRQRSFNAIPLK